MALTPPTGTWLNVMIGSNYDPNDDQQSNSGQDLVGDATNAMLQAQRTGSSNADYTYFFRARYGDANVSGTSFYLAMDTTGDRIADVFIEAKVASNGTTTLYYHKVDSTKAGTGPSNTGWLNSTNDNTVQMTAAAADSLVTVTSAGTNLDGGSSGIDSWVTFGFKLTSLQSFAPAAGMTGDTGTILYAFTSTSQTANGDIAGINDRTADLTKTWADLGLGIQTSLNTITTTSFGTPTVSVTGATVSEASPYIVFNVTLDVASPSAVSFTPSLSSGTATVGADVASSLEYFNGSAWVSASSGVSITGGQTSVLVRAAVTNDTVYEGAESFTFQTGAITGSVMNATGASATGTIKDDGSSTNVFLSTNNTATPTVGTADNDTPTLSVGSVTVSEASPYAVVQVSLSNTSTTAISFTPSLVTGTATVGTDTGSSLEYFNGSSWVSAASGVTITSGSSSVLLRTSIVNDAFYEGSESFSVSTGAITGTVTNSTGANGTVTIKDDGSSTNVFLSTNNTASPTVGTADNDKPTVSVSSVTVSEASPYAVVQVSLDKVSTAAISFTPTLTSGTATVGTDTGSGLEYFNGSSWVSAASGVTVAAGASSVLLRTSIVNDAIYEGSENFSVSTGAITGAVTNSTGANGTVTIKDDGSSTNIFLSTNNTASPTVGTADKDKPTVSVSSVTVSEASPYAVVQVSLDKVSTAAISFTPTLSSGTATVGTDTGSGLEYFNGSSWVSAASGVTVAAGASSVLLRTSIVNDAIYEVSESFSVNTGAITGAVTNSTGANGTVTIKDDGSSSNIFDVNNNTATPTVGTADNDTPTLSVGSVTVSEASPYAVVQVSLDKVSTAAISFTPTLSSGTATVGTDTGSGLEYFNGSSWVSAASGVTVAAGASSVLLRVSIVNDAIYEGSESFSVSTGALTGTVTNSTGASGTVTIKDDGSSTNVFLWNNNSASPTAGTADNDTPTLSVGSVTVSEASDYAVVQVSLDKVSTAAISFTPTLTSGTATVGTDTGSGLEYFNGTAWVSVTGAVTIAAGASSLLLRTTIINDTNYEVSEDFSIGTGAITGAVTNGSGVSGTVTIKDDGTSANVFLSTNNTATPTAGVADNDSPIPGISVSSVTVSEASDYAVVQVSLDKVSTAAISFTPTLTSGTATVGTDTGSGLEYFDGTAWTAVTGTVTIAAGSTSVLLRASIINDTTYEGSESFSINTGSIPAGLVTNSSGASGSVTIKDDGSSSNVFLSTNITSAPTAGSADNDTPTVSVGSVTVSEASPYAVVQVSLDKVSTAAISFTPLLSSGTALVGTDTGSGLEYFDGSHWVPVSGAVTIAAGASSVLLRTTITNDAVYEGSEDFSIGTGAITGAVTNGAGASGTVTIKDDGSSSNVFLSTNNTSAPTTGSADNDTPTVSVGSVTVSEASPYAVVQVSLDKVSTAAISFTPTLTSGTATVGTDTGSGLEYFDGTSWVAVTGAVTIAAGSSSVLLRTSITNDAIYEGSENFSIGTGAITGTVTNSAGTSGTITIKDDGTSANVFLGGNNTATPTTGTADNDKSTISVSSVTVSEASDYAVVQVSLDKVSTAAISFTPSLSSGTATVGTDTGSGLEYFDGTHWVPVSGAVTIAAGTSSVLLRTSITNDAVYEGSEDFSIGTGAITGTVTNGAGASGTVTIKDDGSSSNVFLSTNITSAPTAGSTDNDTPTVSVGSVTVSEASPYAVVQVSLDKVSTAAISFTPLLSSGTALVGTDTGSGLEYFNGSSWVSAAAGVTIAAGASSVLLRASIVNDTVYEGSETFSVSTGTITGTVTNTAGNSGTVTIKDDGSSGNFFAANNNTATPAAGTADNDTPTLSVGSVTVSEASPYAVVQVSLDKVSTSAISFTPSLADGTALVGTDTGSGLEYFDGTSWVAVTGAVTIAAGSSSVLLRTSITNDAIYEGSENFSIGTGAITGTVTNSAGTSGTITIKDDGTSANVFLGGNNTATPTTGTADNDKSTISVSSVTISEASDYAVVQVSLDKVSTAAISFTPSLSSGTATVGTDTGSGLEYFDGTHWVPVSGAVTIAAGASSVLLRTSITNDAVYEGSEDFSIGTGAITGTVTNGAGASGTVTIKDDGSSSNVFLSTNITSAPTAGSTDNDTPTVSVGSVTVSEASPYAVVQVSLEKASASTIGFTPSLLSGTATVGTDTGPGLEYFNGTTWVSASGGVTMAAGATSVLLRTSIVNDTVYEGSEAFSVRTGMITGTVTNTTGNSGTVTIKDDGSSSNVFFANNHTTSATTGTADNDKPTISVSSVTVSEAQPYAQVSVSLSNSSTTAVQFTPTMTGGTAQGQATIGTDTGSVLQYFDGANWLSAAGGVTIAAGSQTVQLRVAIVQDTLYNEGVEKFTVSTGAISGTVSNTGGASGTVSIKDVTSLADPVITDVLETPSDPTPYDLLTARTLQVVTVTGEPGCTVALYKLDGSGNPVLNGTSFSTTEVAGTYTLDFGTNALASGDYEVRLSKSGYNSNYSNSFTIDSTPGLYDITGQRANVKISDTVTVTNGAVGGMDQNRFPTFWNGTDWLDADGEKIRFSEDTLVTFNKAAAPADSVTTSTATSGSTLTLHTQTGTYIYTPSATALTNGGIDTFKVYASDGNKGAFLNLTFDPKDSLDRDGIPASVETNLATLAGNNGDLNNDGIPDATENAVTTLAWTTVDKFNAALNGTLTSSAPVISVVVAQSTTGSAVDSTSQLSDVKVLAPNSATTGGSKPSNATWDPIQFAVEPLQSMGLQDIDPSRAGTQVRVMLDVSRSQMPASSFNAYMKYVNQAAVNMGITDLNGNAITTPGWYDFTQKVAGGDGARFITAGGLLTAIELIITDNAFGDDDPTAGRIYDPGVPVNNTSTPAPAPAYYPVVPTVNSQTTNNIHPVLTGTATLATGETLTVMVNGATYNNVPVVAGQWSLNTGTTVPASGVLGTFVDGHYSVMATARDGVGNTSSDVTSNELTIDLTPPPVPTVDSQSTTSLHPVLTGTATLATGDTLSVSLNGATYNNVSVVNGHWSIDTGTVLPSSGTLGNLVAGNSYPVTATAKDALGNASADLTTNELSIVAPPAPPVVMLPVPPTATPMYAVVLPTGDRWLSSSASEAHPLALVYSSGKAVVDFYISLTAGSDTLALQAWRNVVTGDYVYLPANAKLPYACYVPNTEATLGFVPAAGHGAFDVHLYLNAQGQTQLMGVTEAGQQGLLTQGFTDLGAVFASLSADAAVQPAALVGQVVAV